MTKEDDILEFLLLNESATKRDYEKLYEKDPLTTYFERRFSQPTITKKEGYMLVENGKIKIEVITQNNTYQAKIKFYNEDMRTRKIENQTEFIRTLDRLLNKI